jgi:hypothetical protein
MDHSQSLGLALATTAVLGLSACGGSNDVTSTSSTVPPAAVACTAPDASEFDGYAQFASVCIPATTGGGSSRYDLLSFNATSGGQVVRVDFSNATCTGSAGVAVATAPIQNKTFASNTSTVASLGADGITPTTGSVRTVSVTIGSVYGTGTFPTGVPLLNTGVYTLCKTTPPSVTSTRTIESLRGNGSSRSWCFLRLITRD